MYSIADVISHCIYGVHKEHTMNNELETFGPLIQSMNDFATRYEMSTSYDTYDGANDYRLLWQSENGMSCSIVLSDQRVPSEGLLLQPFAATAETSALHAFYYLGPSIRIFSNIESSAFNKYLNDSRNWAVGKENINYVRGDRLSLIPVFQALKERNPRQRYVAAMTLMHIQDANAVDPLIEALDDMDSRVITFAISALGRLGDARAVQPLLHLLKVGNQGHRVLAARALGLIRNTSAEPILILALKDEDAEVRLSAIEALGNCGSSKSAKSLVEVLKSGDEPTQIASAKALGQVADASVIETMLNQQMYSYKPLRDVIAQSINLIKARKACPMTHD